MSAPYLPPRTTPERDWLWTPSERRIIAREDEALARQAEIDRLIKEYEES